MRSIFLKYSKKTTVLVGKELQMDKAIETGMILLIMDIYFS